MSSQSDVQTYKKKTRIIFIFIPVKTMPMKTVVAQKRNWRTNIWTNDNEPENGISQYFLYVKVRMCSTELSSLYMKKKMKMMCVLCW